MWFLYQIREPYPQQENDNVFYGKYGIASKRLFPFANELQHFRESLVCFIDWYHFHSLNALWIRISAWKVSLTRISENCIFWNRL